mgnify:CR=1 FL=1
MVNQFKRTIIYLIGTGLGSGYAPIAPGTAGSLLAAVLFWILPLNMHWWIFIIVVGFLVGLWVSTQIEREKGEDPGLVVIDEMIGQWLTLIFLPSTLFYLAGGFLLFRLFDIFKPFPINRSQNLKEGWGIMTDDVLAGLYANLLLQFVHWSGVWS